MLQLVLSDIFGRNADLLTLCLNMYNYHTLQAVRRIFWHVHFEYADLLAGAELRFCTAAAAVVRVLRGRWDPRQNKHVAAAVDRVRRQHRVWPAAAQARLHPRRAALRL